MPKQVTRDYQISEEPYSRLFTQAGFASLRTYLGRVAKGQPEIYCAPFSKGDSMGQVLADWKEILVSIQHEWPSLWEFESDLAKKVGPMSVQLPLRERMPDIQSYYEFSPNSKPISRDAINCVTDEFRGLRGLRLRSQQKTVERMKLSSNSGSPYFTKRRNVVQDTLPAEVWYVGKHAFQDVHEAFQAPAVVGWRGQEGGPSEEDVKQRVVWMFPFAVNVTELQVYQPLIEGAQSLGLVPAWISMDAVDQRITALFDTKAADDVIVCTDFSKFDQHFNPMMQECAHDILQYLLTDNRESRDWLNDVFPIKYMIPLVIRANGKKGLVTTTVGKHGMASGSGGTNCDETLAHRALQYDAALHAGEWLNTNSMCLGDDGILTYPGITVHDVVDSYTSHGLEMNVDKQYESTQDCIFLRRWHHKDYRVNGVCVGVYSTCRALGRLRYLERFMDPEYWSPTMVALRQLSIIENCKWHPLFHEFIEFCMKRDKYRLGIDIPGFLDNIAHEAQKATDYMPDFLGYTKTLQGEGAEGIAAWEVVKYLKSK